MTHRAQWHRGIGHPPVVQPATFRGRAFVTNTNATLTAATFAPTIEIAESSSMTAATFTGSVAVT